MQTNLAHLFSPSAALAFVQRQQRDWKVTVARTSFDRLAYQIVYPYLSIYIVALGATATQLGIVTSIGMIIAGLCGPFVGWFIDQMGPKKIYLAGIGLLGVSYLTYGLAHDWTITILAAAAYWIGYSVSTHSCATVCGNCLPNEDRATGMTFCETVAAGLLGLAGPIIGAALVVFFGGANANGIRPLFFVAALVTVGTFSFILAQLSNRRWRPRNPQVPNLIRDITQVLKGGPYLKQWLVLASVGGLPLGMVFPFAQVFAQRIKGADEFTLGAIVTASALASILFAIPFGRLADKFGRKRVLYLAIPLFWVSNLVLVLAPLPGWLVLVGALQGFYYIGGPISAAMERELVPAEQMGRWLGIARFVRMLVNAALTFVSGMVWDRIGPQYVFLLFVGIDLVVRMPLLIRMPETLRLDLGAASSAAQSSPPG
jgi:MFS family permease